MTKRGSQDNVVTYEHYCDTKADLYNIPQDKITLGSVAIVLKDEGNEMGIYLANSNKEWISFSTGGSGGENNMGDISLANLIDVSLANPNDGDTLIYDGTTNKWIAQANNNFNNKIMFVNVDSNGSLDKTFREIYNHVINGGSVIIQHVVNAEGNYMFNIFYPYYIGSIPDSFKIINVYAIDINNNTVSPLSFVTNDMDNYPSMRQQSE